MPSERFLKTLLKTFLKMHVMTKKKGQGSDVSITAILEANPVKIVLARFISAY